MPRVNANAAPASLNRFGDLLKYLRRRARMTQRELAIEVGYSEVHISRLESTYRPPSEETLLALFVPALDLQAAPELVARLLELATAERSSSSARTPVPHPPAQSIIQSILEPVPLPPHGEVARLSLLQRLGQRLASERVVAVCGLAGTGKTSLVAALARVEAQTRPLCWFTFTTGVTTSALALLHGLARFALAHGQQQVRSLLEPDAAVAGSTTLEEQIALLNATLTQMAWAAIDRRDTPYSRLPLLCFDNVHLVEGNPAVMAVLRQLATTPVALLLISRSSVPLPGVVELRVQGLERSEGQALIAQSSNGLDAALAERLLQKTASHPMLLRLALGLLDQASDPASVIAHLEHAPPLVTYLLDTTLQQLSQSAEQLLLLIAVFRQPPNLYDPALRDLLQPIDGIEDVETALAELQRYNLLDHPAQAQLHPLIRDYTEVRLGGMRARAERLHELAAHWLEQMSHNVVEAAYHYAAAGDLERAGELLHQQRHAIAGQGRSFAAVEVIDTLVQQARRRATHPDLIRQLLTLRADLLVGTPRAAEAEHSYRAALQYTQQPAIRAQLAARIAQCLVQSGQAEEALRVSTAARATLDGSHPLVLGHVLIASSHAELKLEDYEAARQSAQATLDLLAPFAHDTPPVGAELRVQAHQVVATVLHYQQQHAAALEQLQRAIAAAQAGDLPHLEQRCQIDMVTTLIAQGDLEQAIRVGQHILPLLQAANDSYATARLLLNLGLSYLTRAQVEQAFTAIDQACTLAENIGDTYTLADGRFWGARILLAGGRVYEARIVVERLLKRAAASGAARTYGSALALLAMVQLSEGDARGALETSTRALALPVSTFDGRLRATLLLYQVLALLLNNADAEAEQVLESVVLDRMPTATMFAHNLVRAALQLVRGDNPSLVVRSLNAIAAEADAQQHYLYGNSARRLLAATKPVPARVALPALLWVEREF
jgi:ATP/maltotriose-dependent transcriptional regulator MalT/DNA-binding XRE family transcriptional regulator